MKNSHPYSLVIFDWDGTLMDSTGRIVSAMRRSAKNVSLPIPTEAAVKSIIGLSMDALMDKLFPYADKKGRQQLLDEYRYQYIDGDNTPTPLFEGVIDSLEWFKQKEITIAIATGKARAGLTRVLKEVNLEHYFDHSICADEAQSKPHPEMIHQLLKRTNTEKRQSIIVGDSIHDLSMAKNANIDAIGVTSGANEHHELSEYSPKAIFEQIHEFKDWFESH